MVASVLAEDGRGVPAQTNTTSYTYHSLRQDSFGRGPLGFHRVEVFDQASQFRTVSTYAQAYPYSGMPTEVDKYQVVGSQSHLTNETTTTYCDTLLTPPPPGLGCGSVAAGPIPPGTTTFVYPSVVTDIAYLHPENDDLSNRTHHDLGVLFDLYGNALVTTTGVTKVEGGVTESFSKKVHNTYTTAEEQLEGKPDSTVVHRGRRNGPDDTTTTFEYSPLSAFGGAYGSRIALTKKHVEPQADWPLRLDMAYFYDPFGNVVTTTSCANDFELRCGRHESGRGEHPVHHPPFRTTTASYDPAMVGVTRVVRRRAFPGEDDERSVRPHSRRRPFMIPSWGRS